MAEPSTRVDKEPSPVAPVLTESVEILFLVDVSGSMLTNGKIQSLNVAVEESLPLMRQSATTTPGLKIGVRVLAFGTDVEWLVPESVPIEEFVWPDVTVRPEDLSEVGLALSAVIGSMTRRDLDERSAQNLILLSDGMATDTREPTFKVALANLNDHPMGISGSRIAVAIGSDADPEMLQEFVRPTDGAVLTAHSPQQLAAQIHLAGATVISGSSESIW